jgi:hypothetical protein
VAEELRIDPTDAKARVDAGEAIILDVVSPMAWVELDIAIKGLSASRQTSWESAGGSCPASAR